MKCTVFRSDTREYTYLYVAEDQAYEDLPEGLQKQFGQPEKVMELELGPQRTLAQEDVLTVIDNLQRQGYHLQMPPKEDPSGWLDLPEP